MMTVVACICLKAHTGRVKQASNSSRALLPMAWHDVQLPITLTAAYILLSWLRGTQPQGPSDRLLWLLVLH